MPLVALQTQPPTDPFAAVRALNRMHRAGFSLTVRADKLVVSPADRLSDEQRAFLQAHKADLVALLQDAETLLENLTLAAPAGLGWMEGTPAGWTGERLLATGEVLYATGQMVNRNGRRFLREPAPTGIEPPASDPLPEPAPKPAPYAPDVCRWDQWGDRLVMKCADPAPNADGSGCANCGGSKP